MKKNYLNETLRRALLICGMTMSTLAMMAGGLVTNTNMSAAYLRNPAREGAIDIDGVYFNPAGTAFLTNGVHIGVSIETAFQQRISTVSFAPFAMNRDYMGQTSRKYVGKTTAPVIPAIHFTYNWDRWNLQAGFNIIGGGGKCKFNDGLGMFEAALAGNALQLKQATGQNVAYTLSQSITGESYQYGIYLGTSFEVWKEHLAISVGLQGNYTNNRYNGGLRDMQLWMGDDYSIPAYNYLIGAAAQKEAAGDVTTAAQLNAAAAKVQNMPDVELDCRQTGFGVTPVLGIDLRVNEIFNVSFRYQFQTVMKLKNNSTNSASADAMTQLANFQDGKKLRSDVPGFFSVGMQVAPIEKLRINASYRYFDEKHAKRDMVNDAANEKNEGTHEPCVGIEYDIFKYLTFSAGYQAGIYKQTNDERSELDFQVNSHSILVGFRINAGSHVNIDLGYMHSFYDKKDKTQDMGNGLEYKTNFWRKNDVFGVGVGLAF